VKLKTISKDDILLIGKGDNTLKRTVFMKLKNPKPKLDQSFIPFHAVAVISRSNIAVSKKSHLPVLIQH